MTFLKGYIPWNKGLKGWKHKGSFKKGHCLWDNPNSRKHQIKKGDINERSIAWKGDEVGYYPLHQWVVKRLGRPSKCSKCNKKNVEIGRSIIHWANISRQYKRDLRDWVALCPSCHEIADLRNEDISKYGRGKHGHLIEPCER